MVKRDMDGAYAQRPPAAPARPGPSLGPSHGLGLGLGIGRRARIVPLAVLLAAAAPPSSAPSFGPRGAESCTGCHVGGGGIGLLQGRPAADTVRMMEAYRSGQQPATLMNRIVAGFTPDEVTQLAFWFAAQTNPDGAPGR